MVNMVVLVVMMMIMVLSHNDDGVGHKDGDGNIDDADGSMR